MLFGGLQKINYNSLANLSCFKCSCLSALSVHTSSFSVIRKTGPLNYGIIKLRGNECESFWYFQIWLDQARIPHKAEFFHVWGNCLLLHFIKD